MKRRTKKVLSLILAASLVFTLNTAAFGEEIVAEEAVAGETIVEPAEDVAADDTEVETVAEGVVAESEASDAELEDAELAAADHEEDGIVYEDADGTRPLTTITYVSNGKKKNPEDNVAIIKNTTDPVSWNNFYAADLMEAVLSGGENKDTYYHNDSKVGVSRNDGTVPGKVKSDSNAVYDSIEVEKGVYLFVKYAVGDYGNNLYYGNELGTWKVEYSTKSAFVEGYSAYADEKTRPLQKVPGTGAGANADDDALDDLAPLFTILRVSKLPCTVWDGRKVAWNKSGFHNANKSTKEVLDVQVALVKYENGTVTEIYGAKVLNVLIDKKAIKAASLTNATEQMKITGKYTDTSNDKTYDANFYVPAHEKMDKLPTFTIKVKTEGDAKKYNKQIKKLMKKRTYEFGILQNAIIVTDPTEGNVTVAVDPAENINGAFNYEYLREYSPADGYEMNYHVKDAEVDDDANTVGYSTGIWAWALEWFIDQTIDPLRMGYCDNHNLSYKAAPSVFGTASGNDAHNEEGTGISDLITGDNNRDDVDSSFMRGGYVDNVDVDSMTVGDSLFSKGLKVSKFNGDKGKATVTNEVYIFSKGVEKPREEVRLKTGKHNDYSFEKLSLAGVDVWTLNFPENGNYTYAYTDPGTAYTRLRYDKGDLSIFGFKWAFRKSPVEKSKKFRAGIASADDSGFIYEAE